MHTFFLPIGGSGARFCIFHPPHAAGSRGCVLYVHPFAEEMNKSRRMAALQSRTLAQAGFAVLQIDLLGCGDSTGDSGDAHWQHWIDDLAAAHAWLRERADGSFWFWGLRAGCLLAADAAAQIGEEAHFLFWQPASAGKPLIQQFLRLKAAGEMIGGAAKGVVETLRRQLAAGEPVEVAGYALAPQLVRGFDDATLAPPAGSPHAQRRVEWFEISNRADAGLLPASAATVERWRTAGFDVSTRVVPGAAFWQTTEIEETPELIDATSAALVAAYAIESGA